MSARERRELAALEKMPDSAIDTSDIPEVTDWSKAQVGRFYRPIKQPVTIRLDADVVAWFKATAPQYQTAVNKVLREHMERNAANDSSSQPKAKKKRG
ncbi:BrnA antitoxin family protein [Dongia deserti]|uniref:BrnA antitoxin family protein n=1 Tax=Dongia deserti TaxID=2268030 RepID=UPI000E6589E4|nr:BrnA antitoxin family protein [Dongia deserti]